MPVRFAHVVECLILKKLHLRFLRHNLNSAENPGNRFEKGIAKCPQAKSEYLS